MNNELRLWNNKQRRRRMPEAQEKPVTESQKLYQQFLQVSAKIGSNQFEIKKLEEEQEVLNAKYVAAVEAEKAQTPK